MKEEDVPGVAAGPPGPRPRDEPLVAQWGVAGLYLKREFLVFSTVNLKKGSIGIEYHHHHTLQISSSYPDDTFVDTATSHYGDDTASSPNIIFIYEVILVWGFSLYDYASHRRLRPGTCAGSGTFSVPARGGPRVRARGS